MTVVLDYVRRFHWRELLLALPFFGIYLALGYLLGRGNTLHDPKTITAVGIAFVCLTLAQFCPPLRR